MSIPARWFTIVLAAAVMTVATPAVSPALLFDDGHDWATGGGQRISFRFTFEARSEEPGTEPKGRFTFTVPEQIHATGSVTCFRADGNRAVIGGQLEEGWAADETLGPPEDEGFLFWVEDNGPPVDGQSPDRMTPVIVFGNLPGADFPFVCPPPIPPVDVLFRTLNKGNITVHDG